MYRVSMCAQTNSEYIFDWGRLGGNWIDINCDCLLLPLNIYNVYIPHPSCVPFPITRVRLYISFIIYTFIYNTLLYMAHPKPICHVHTRYDCSIYYYMYMD